MSIEKPTNQSANTQAPLHTPGPWHCERAKIAIDGAYDYAIYTLADRQIIAEAFGRSDVTRFHNAEANACLIAAAPDLLAALKRTVELADAEGFAVPAEALAAIAKAEGK